MDVKNIPPQEKLQFVHVQYCLVFEESFGRFPIPIFVIVRWAIHQARSLGIYPNSHFGHRLESGELRDASHSRVVIAGPQSSIIMLEVNSGLGSNGRSSAIALYA